MMLLDKKLGFTLIEMLVVLMIVAVMLSMVTVNFSRDERQQLQQEAHKLALLLSHAGSVARTSGKPIAWSNQGQQYGFYALLVDNGRHWQALTMDNTLRVRQLPEGVGISTISISGALQKQGARLIFSPAGLDASFSISLQSEKFTASVQGDIVGNVTHNPAKEKSP